MAASYTISCTCGAEQQVQATQAGMSLPCVCGKSVEVPSLGKLKASVGESAVSADFEIEHLLATNSLPLEVECCECHQVTNHQRLIRVVCETVSSKPGQVGVMGCLGFLYFGWIGYFLMKKVGTYNGHEVGQHVAFSLPIRICERCSLGFKSVKQAKDVLLASPLYSKLLKKYPDTKVSLLT